MMYKKSKGTGVTVKDGENINQALRRFKRKIDDSGLLDDLRAKEFYEKPTLPEKERREPPKLAGVKNSEINNYLKKCIKIWDLAPTPNL